MTLSLADSEFPVRLRFERSLTDDELLRFCSKNDPLRVERDANGELIVMSPNLSDGAGVEGDVFLELGVWARADGRGKAFPSSAGFTLPDTSMRAADAAWVTFERWNGLTDAQRHSFSPLVPEFVIEIRSASDRLPLLREKMAMWIANGTELAWMVDPIRRVIEIYRPGDGVEVRENPSSVQGDGPLRGFELVMNRIWG